MVIQETSRLQAGSVPNTAIREASRRLELLEIPVGQSTLVLAGIGYFNGLRNDELREFVLNATRRGPSRPASTESARP